MSKRIILITGANRGLGLGFVKHYLGSTAEIFAATRDPNTCRELQSLHQASPDSLHLLNLDVTQEESIREAASQIQKKVGSLDLLINNAGRYGEKRDVSLEEINLDDLRLTFEVNTLGPLRVTRAFRALLKAGREKKLVHITSLMGSISDNSSGSAYGYRISKTALNMLNRNLGHELKADGIVSVALHPGWVQTDMGGKNAPLTVDESVGSMIRTIDHLKLSQSGQFLQYDGTPCPF